MPSRLFRRTRWLIDHDVQVRLSIRLGACLITYVVLFCLLSIGESLLVATGLYTSDLSPDLARAQLLGFTRTVLAPLMFAVACMVLHGVLMLHRLAGPIYRVRRGLEALTDRRLNEPMRLRKGDYLTSVATLYNDAADRLREDLDLARREVSAARQAETLEEAKSHLERLEAELAKYHLGLDLEPAAPVADPAEAAAS